MNINLKAIILNCFVQVEIALTSSGCSGMILILLL